MTYPLMLVRITILKQKLKIADVAEIVDKLKPFYTVSGNAKWCSDY